MRATIARVAVGVAALLVATLAAQTGQAPSDFALKLIGGLCAGDTIDTFEGTYTRHIDGERTASARFELAPSEQQRLYQLVTAVDLAAYPEYFNPASSSVTIPSPVHVITIRRAGVEHTVRWTDIGSRSPEAVRLRGFIRDLRAFFRDRPEIRRLPKQEAFCM